MQRELEIAKELALAAGTAIMRHYAEEFAVEYKDAANQDPVTGADKEANQIIVEGLAAAFPDDAILAEESTPQAARLSARRLWCVDPLDGTREFVARNGEFVVMIGLAIEGRASLGVVYQPTTDSLYWGAEGQARARVAGREFSLAVSSVADPVDARMVVSRSHRSKTVSAVAARLGISQETSLGSVGLKAVQVATRLADLYLSVSSQTHEWDACAPEAIVRAAGGQASDITGEPLCYNKPTTQTPHGIVFTNGALHQACLAALQPVASERGWLPR